MILSCVLAAGCALPHAELRGDGAAADQSTDAADRVSPTDVADAQDAADVPAPQDVLDAGDAMEMDADAAIEAGMDAEAGMDVADTGVDAREAGPDAMDTGADARDAGPDAMDTAVDARPDSAPDSMPDSAPDSMPDSMPDSAPDSMPDSAPDSMPDSAPDSMPDSAPDAPLRYRLGATTALAWRPDAPGGGVQQSLCPANSIMVGAVTYKAGIPPTLNGATLRCAAFNTDGTLGAVSSSPMVGDTTLSIMRSPSCGAGEVAVANGVRTGTLVDDALFDCVGLARLLPPMRAESVASTQRFTDENGGSFTATRCATGSVAVGIEVTEGSCGALCGNRINRLRFVCAPIETF